MANMLDRFRGGEGERLLKDALGRQTALQGLDAAINGLSSVATLAHYEAGDEVIKQDSADNDISFILSGSVSIVINQRVINSRRAGQHVGEMALIDSSARRSSLHSKRPCSRELVNRILWLLRTKIHSFGDGLQ
jgi:CRP/FNR family transcriptional regulator, cyclic AMP receptor protein